LIYIYPAPSICGHAIAGAFEVEGPREWRVECGEQRAEGRLVESREQRAESRLVESREQRAESREPVSSPSVPAHLVSDYLIRMKVLG
jgi:hypothetical protein